MSIWSWNQSNTNWQCRDLCCEFLSVQKISQNTIFLVADVFFLLTCKRPHCCRNHNWNLSFKYCRKLLIISKISYYDPKIICDYLTTLKCLQFVKVLTMKMAVVINLHNIHVKVCVDHTLCNIITGKSQNSLFGTRK